MFTGLQPIIIGLLFSLEIVKVGLGSISTASFTTWVEAAILIGMLCGFSEQTLPTAVAQQAASLLKGMEPKGTQ